MSEEKKTVTYKRRMSFGNLPYKKSKKKYIKLTRPIWTNSIYRYKQQVDGVNIVGVSSALTSYNGQQSYILQQSSEINYGFNFRLNDIPQVTTFTSLYDSYRIKKIIIRLSPTVQSQTMSFVTLTNVAASAGTPVPVGQCYWSIDHDDSASATMAQLRQYSTVKYQNVNKGKDIVATIYPKIALGAYAGAFTSYATQGNQWLDCGSPDIQHYGFKFACDAYNSANYYQIWRVSCFYFVEFKNVR